MEGSATFTIVASRTIMSMPAQSTSSASQRDVPVGLWWSFCTALVINKHLSESQVRARICSMRCRTYGQFCGLAHALELVGERWALLIIRDLVLGPKRFTDLHRGLPRIPTNVLSARLKELEAGGVVRRTILPRPASGLAYELSEYGRELEDVLLRLGLWGAKSMSSPLPDEIVTTDSLVMALRASFQPEAAAELRARFEVRVGEIVVHACVDHGVLETAEGGLAGPDLVIQAGPAIRA